MRIEIGVVPPSPAYRAHDLSYEELLVALTRPGEWVRVPLAEIKGETLNAKRISIRRAAESAGLPVQTRSDGEYLYITKRPVYTLIRRFAETHHLGAVDGN